MGTVGAGGIGASGGAGMGGAGMGGAGGCPTLGDGSDWDGRQQRPAKKPKQTPPPNTIPKHTNNQGNCTICGVPMSYSKVSSSFATCAIWYAEDSWHADMARLENAKSKDVHAKKS